MRVGGGAPAIVVNFDTAVLGTRFVANDRPARFQADPTLARVALGNGREPLPVQLEFHVKHEVVIAVFGGVVQPCIQVRQRAPSGLPESPHIERLARRAPQHQGQSAGFSLRRRVIILFGGAALGRVLINAQIPAGYMRLLCGYAISGTDTSAYGCHRVASHRRIT